MLVWSAPGIDTFLEWKIVVGQRRFTSGHRTVGGEEEDRNNHEIPNAGLAPVRIARDRT